VSSSAGNKFMDKELLFREFTWGKGWEEKEKQMKTN
jgi:hypothetical protein